MHNDPNKGTRKQLLAIKKPQSGIPVYVNPRKLEEGKEPVTFTAGFVLETNETDSTAASCSSKIVADSDAVAPQAILACL